MKRRFSANNEKVLDDLSFSEKRVLVMGLGLHGGGAGTVEFLAKRGAVITVTDLRSARELAPTLRSLKHLKGIRYVLGRHRVRDFDQADIVVKNPGVRPDSPYLAAAKRNGARITSDIGIFFDVCPAPVIGITGTRGKSTTTYLIWKFFTSKYGARVHYGGNIRRSALLLLPKIKKGDLAVLELSSFQLTDLWEERKSPHIAVITNVLRDHLNWHTDMRDYIRAKSAIFEFQKPDDHLFFNGEDAVLRRLAGNAPSRVHAVSGSAVFGRKKHSNILKNVGMWESVDRNLGEHYRPSAALAVAVARHLRIPASAIRKILSRFHGLPERQEEIAVKNGVHFIDDTTATTPDAAVAAIRRFRKIAGAGHKIILIAGGSDKKLDFKEMARAIRQSVDELVLLPGAATKRILEETRINPRFNRGQESRKPVRVDSMRKAVQAAYRAAEKGDYVLLSPGAASFGLFLNEFDRGAQFQKSVKKMK